jgi:hypothetical protein
MEKPEVLVRRLKRRHKMSESKIVAELAKLGVKTSQPTLNRLSHGKARRPSFDLAVGLDRLHEQLTQAVSG